jgi:large subunit ribosomal protein L28
MTSVFSCLWHRNIDKAGGLDAYILNTPQKKLQSDVATELREQMLRRLAASRQDAGQAAALPREQQVQQQQQQQQPFLPPAARAAVAAAAADMGT